ncbi:hypothetical protein IEQ34_006884 [Dendrobium chrysotoxum]|uniref:MADS-box domain-containing protein n=1 Tax=Dendrobium chrysotoxum TaxID=161865 RepID=A0AAV7H823_DENCH|nr:hypothetical protein IEQ34_006884 [Dendrobium chrysotoxum]
MSPLVEITLGSGVDSPIPKMEAAVTPLPTVSSTEEDNNQKSITIEEIPSQIEIRSSSSIRDARQNRRKNYLRRVRKKVIKARKTAETKGKGRKKIEIKRIDKEANRQVCFSKRRQGLFKKANELCTLCGAEVAIIVFSIAGKPYSFGHPSVDHVLQRFINVPGTSEASSVATTSFEPMNRELVYLCGNLEEEINKGRSLNLAKKALSPVSNPFWWDNNLHLMGIEELREYEKVLQDLQAIISQTAQQSRCHAPEAVMRQIDGSSMAAVGEANYLMLQQQWQQQWQNYELAECDYINRAQPML